MATVTKDFRLKAGLVVEGSTATVNGKNVITAGIVDAKGDLIVGSADDTVVRLGVGTNGYVLTAASGETSGLAWSAPAAVGTFDSSIVFEGATANDHETTLAVTDPTADRTITLPDATGTVALTSDVTTHANLTEAHGATGAVVGTTNTQTLTNKTLTTPTINGPTITDTGQTPTIHGIYLPAPHTIIFEGTTANDFETTLTAGEPTGDRTVTLPDATGTVALTNNKLDAFAATTSAELRTVISDETGTGGLVFADTPTLVTPNIGAATGTSLVLSGDLTVNGTTTTINSTEITIDDKNLTLGSVATPTDAGADGGGLTLKGATDKTFSWVDATDAWTSSEHLDLGSGKVLKVAGTQVLSATEYTGNAATVTNGVYTTSKISALASTSSSELAGVISDETGTGALVFANTPTLVTPVIGAATGTTLVLSGALTGTAITLNDSSVGSATATAGTSATTIDTWSASTYSSAKYIVQMKLGNDIEVIEVLVTVDGSNNVYLTEYADVISNTQLGTTDAVYSAGNVLLQVTAASVSTVVKLHRIYIEA